MSNDLIPNNRGLGFWRLELYNPSGKVFDRKGYLYISKDHHIIFKDAKFNKTTLNLPSQNVAYVDLIETEKEDEF